MWNMIKPVNPTGTSYDLTPFTIKWVYCSEGMWFGILLLWRLKRAGRAAGVGRLRGIRNLFQQLPCVSGTSRGPVPCISFALEDGYARIYATQVIYTAQIHGHLYPIISRYSEPGFNSKAWASKEGLSLEPKGLFLWFFSKSLLQSLPNILIYQSHWVPPTSLGPKVDNRTPSSTVYQARDHYLAVGLTQGQWPSGHLVKVSEHLSICDLFCLPYLKKYTVCYASCGSGEKPVFSCRRDV